MHPTFQISPQASRELDHSGCRLVIDAGRNHFCFAVQILETGEFVALEYYQFKNNQQDDLRQLVQTDPLLQQAYGAVDIFYNNTQGLLVPSRYYHPDQANHLLELLRGDIHAGLPLEDHIPEMDVMQLYTVQPELHEALAKKYSNASFSHFNTGWLKKKFRQQQKSTLLEVVLYPAHIIVALWNDDRLLINQCYEYDTPEDVAWWLLNVTSQWEVNPQEVPVMISGLVETSSPMYAEIQKYFLNVELDTRPGSFRYDFNFDNYPQHFFSPIFSLALCGS